MLSSTPDGEEVVADRSQGARLALPPLLIVDEVVAFLDAHGLGSGPIAWERIGDGQSNVTYRIQRGDDVFVLRRGPRPPLPRSTHDMVREARVQQVLAGHGTPVPQVLAVCTDESVLGVPFYVMSHVDGVVITDAVPEHLSSAEDRAATSRAVVDTLAALHKVQLTPEEIASLGRPEGYLARQVERFSSLWHVNTLRSLDQVEPLGEWLRDNMPQSQRVSVIHGDYRTGNVMFSSRRPAEVVAILDWEMATVGDPLADLGYLTATYAEQGRPVTALELTSVTREPGYLTAAELIDRYREQVDVDVSSLHWYQALAMWKAAIFCEAIYTRWLRGERPDDNEFGPSLEAGVPMLFEAAREYAGLATTSAG